MTASASDVAYDGIRNMLTRGELSPGQRLSQSRLARQLQCSPMPVVEAMRRLESEGLLVKQARKQARVRELSHDDVEGAWTKDAAVAIEAPPDTDVVPLPEAQWRGASPVRPVHIKHRFEIDLT